MAVARGGSAQVFKHLGVKDGRGDFIDAHGPLAEVDAAAAVRAEGEVFTGGGDQLATGGAVDGFL